jgi:predicted transcriptional regulator of viral defense system
MKFIDLLAIIGEQPCFETGLLLAGPVNPDDIRRQLSRWVHTGHIIQLRRGLYALTAPHRRNPIHPFVLSNALLPGSYVSLQSALAFHGLIPEHVVTTQGVTMRRPAAWHTALGDFSFRHIAPHLFFGYEYISLSDQHQAFVAFPEKALLDLVHLTPGGDDPSYLAELRLQNLDRLDQARLQTLAGRAGKPKWLHAAACISALARADQSAYTDG